MADAPKPALREWTIEHAGTGTRPREDLNAKGQNSRVWYGELALRRLITSHKGQFRWRTPEENPYLIHDQNRKLFESRYADVAFALRNA